MHRSKKLLLLFLFLREREGERVSVIRRPFSRAGNRRPGIEINLYTALKGGGEGEASSKNRKVDRSWQVNFRDTIDVYLYDVGAFDGRLALGSR